MSQDMMNNWIVFNYLQEATKVWKAKEDYVQLNEIKRKVVTCVPLETGRRIAPAPATVALAVAMDGRRELKAEAER
jgi:hypothetical protein